MGKGISYSVEVGGSKFINRTELLEFFWVLCAVFPWKRYKQRLFSKLRSWAATNRTADWSKWHSRKLHFFVMATRAKRTKFTAEEVLVQMVNENEFDSDHGGVSSGKKSDIDRQLMDFDEESR